MRVMYKLDKLTVFRDIFENLELLKKYLDFHALTALDDFLFEAIDENYFIKHNFEIKLILLCFYTY